MSDKLESKLDAYKDQKEKTISEFFQCLISINDPEDLKSLQQLLRVVKESNDREFENSGDLSRKDFLYMLMVFSDAVVLKQKHPEAIVLIVEPIKKLILDTLKRLDR